MNMTGPEVSNPIANLLDQIKEEVTKELQEERERVKKEEIDEEGLEEKKSRKKSDHQLVEQKKKQETEKLIKLTKKTEEVRKDFSEAIRFLQSPDERELLEGVRKFIRVSFFAQAGLKIIDDPVDNKILANLNKLLRRLDQSSFISIINFLIPYFNQEKQIQFSADPSVLTSFEKDIKTLAETNKFLAERIKELIELSYTNIEEYSGLPKSIVLERLTRIISPEEKSPQKTSLITPEEKLRFEQYEKQRMRIVREYREKADPSDRRDIEQEIAIAISTGDKEALREILKWSDDQIEDYIKLNKKISGLGGVNNFLQTAEHYGFSFSQEEVAFLSSVFWENFFDSLFEKRDGQIVLNQQGIEILRSRSIFLLTKLLNRMDPEQDWQRGWNELQEGVIFRGIIGNLYKLTNSAELKKRLGEEGLLNFQREIEKTVNTLYAELTARELYHEMRRYIVLGIAAPKDMANFMKRFPASRLTYILETFDAEIVEMVRSVFESQIQYKIATNNNIIDSGIFKTFFDTPNSVLKTEYYEEVRDLVFEYFKKKYGKNINLLELDWRIKRAMVLGMGFSFAVSTRLPSILAMAEPRGDFSGQPFITQFFNLRHQWRLGRGGESLNLYPEMFDLEIPFSPDMTPESFFIRLRKHWSPKKVYKGKGKRIEEIERELFEELNQQLGFLSYEEVRQKGGRYRPQPINILLRDQLRRIVLPDFLSRGGWRLEPFKTYISEEYGISASELDDFDKVYKYIGQYVGVGALWLLDADRVSLELKKILPQELFGKDFKLLLDPGQISKIMDSITLYRGESAQKLLDFSDLDGNVIKMTVGRFILEKGLHLRGLHFLELLKRSPLDFLTIMLQFEPWMSEIVTTKQGEKLTAFEYYFASEKDFKRFSKADQSIIRERLERLEKRWGKENIVHIRRLAKFWHDYYRSEPSLDRNLMIKRLFNQLTLARAKVMSENKLTMSAEDISDKVIRELLFGKEGLIGYFDGLGERFAEKSTDFGKLGDRGFFYTLAKRWFLIEKIGLNPCLNDSKMGPIFRNIERIGADPFARNWGDQATFAESLSKFPVFDKLIKHVSSSHDWEIMFKEFHKTLDGISGAFGISGAQEIHALMMFVWIRYFQTHYIDRLPFPLNLASMFLGKQVSLSTLKDGWLAYRLRDEDIRQIILYAEHEGFIGEEHKIWLEKALGVGLDMYAPKVMTSIVILMIFIIMAQLIKKAQKEQMEKKN